MPDAALRDLALRRQADRLDGLARGVFDGFEHPHLARRDKQDGIAGAPRAAGAADAMHIGFGVVGHVIIDDVADARHVQPARGDVGGDDDVEAAALQALDDLLAQTLRHVAIQRRGFVAARLQLFGEIDRRQLGAHENQGGLEILLDFEHARQRFELVGAAHLPIALADRRHRRGGGMYPHFPRVAQVALGDATDRRGHGRRKQGGLARRRRVLEDPFDIVDEAHAQHLVSLVEHQRGEVVELQTLALEVVHDATRRADNDMHAARQGTQLDHHALPAIHRQDMEAGHVVRVFLEGFGNLDGQFARRRQHQHLGHLFGEIESRQQRQGESRRLAGAGLRLAQQVASSEKMRDAGRLDRRRSFVADGREGGQQGRGQLQRGKAFNSFGHGSSAGPPQGGAAKIWSGRSPRTSVTPFFGKGAGGKKVISSRFITG